MRRARLAPLRQLDHRVGQLADRRQRPRISPQPQRLFELRRQLLRRQHRPRMSPESALQRVRQRLLADHRRRTRRRLRRRLLSAARTASASDVRVSFESAQISSVPTSVSFAPSFTGTSRSPALPNRSTACSGACRCSSSRSSGENSTTSPGLSSVRVRELYKLKRHRLVRHQLQIPRIDLDRRAFFRPARHQTHRPQLVSIRRQAR